MPARALVDVAAGRTDGQRDTRGSAEPTSHVGFPGERQRDAGGPQRAESHVHDQLERAIGSIAGSQYGIVTRTQLADLGLAPGTIDSRLRCGRLHLAHRGIYCLVRPDARHPLAAPTAAVLACGPGAVVSHRSAAAIWGFWPTEPAAVDVTVTGNVRSRPGIRVHRTAALDRRDRTLKGGIPITTPARALVELAAELPTREIERAFDEAVIRRITSRDSVRQARRRATQRGTAALDALLTTTGATRSDAERRLRALLRRSGLPAPEINARVGPYEVDFLWREERLIVEVDGFAFHSARTAFERDRRRDAHLQSLGFRVLRITWRALEYEPELVLVQLAQALVRPVA